MARFCPVDTDRFARDCRIPVFNERINMWVLIRDTVRAPSDRDLMVEAVEVVEEWLSDANAKGDFFSASVVRTVEGLPTTSAVIPEGGGEPVRVPLVMAANRSTDCPIPITTQTKDFVFVIVRFVFRGNIKSIGWPVNNAQFLLGKECPVQARWFVDRVFKPDVREEVPVEKPDPTIGEAIRGAAEGAADAAKNVATAYAVIAGLGLLAFLVVTSRK